MKYKWWHVITYQRSKSLGEPLWILKATYTNSVLPWSIYQVTLMLPVSNCTWSCKVLCHILRVSAILLLAFCHGECDSIKGVCHKLRCCAKPLGSCPRAHIAFCQNSWSILLTIIIYLNSCSWIVKWISLGMYIWTRTPNNYSELLWKPWKCPA